MDLSGIISISGMGGLFKVVAQSKNGLIVESLVDKKRLPAYSSYKISTLEDISIYSTGEDVPLSDVLQKIFDKEKGGPAIDPKSSDADLKKYFEAAFPEYDKERVYTSDIKKVINWYNLLQKSDMLKPKKEEASSENAGEEGGDKKAAKKTAAKKEAGAVKPKAKPTKEPTAKTTSRAPKKTTTVRKTGA